MCRFPKGILQAGVFLGITLSRNYCSFKFSWPPLLPANKDHLGSDHHGIFRNISSFSMLLRLVLKLAVIWGWRHGSAVERTSSHRTFRFNSQHPHGGSQLSVTPVPENPMPSSDPHRHQIHVVHTHTFSQNVHNPYFSTASVINYHNLSGSKQPGFIMSCVTHGPKRPGRRDCFWRSRRTILSFLASLSI